MVRNMRQIRNSISQGFTDILPSREREAVLLINSNKYPIILTLITMLFKRSLKNMKTFLLHI